MNNEMRPLEYATPPKRQKISLKLSNFPPSLGFAGAVVALLVAEYFWISGVFGLARLYYVANLVVMSTAAVGTYIGCYSGFRRHDKAEASGVGQLSGCLFGALNLIAALFLTASIVRLCGLLLGI